MKKEKSRKRELENTERESEKGERRECGKGRVTVEKDGAIEVEMGEGWKWCKRQLKKCLNNVAISDNFYRKVKNGIFKDPLFQHFTLLTNYFIFKVALPFADVITDFKYV